MFKYILKRIGAAILILLGVSFVLYALLRCMPTDFVEAKILALNTSGATVTEEFKQQMYKTYGLDGSIVQGYFSWLGNICHLNFGKSFINQREVLSEVFDPGRIGTSFIVAAVSTVFEFLIAIPLGITAATHQYSVRDYVVTVLVLVGISLPSFFFGQLLKDIFANKLGWFPVWSSTSPNYVLPIIALSVYPMAYITRLTKTSMLDSLNQDYIRTARAKGVPGWKVIFKHALRNALIPVITYVGPMVAYILTGSMVVENIFTIGGLGSSFVTSITNRDYTMIMATTIFLAILMVVANLLTDIAYKFVDPRITFE